ncbi:MAG: hypothetical protein HN798_08065 [Chloroflexi bacterium]|jgi:hypothetical protein|nr:hypothetical protein [Chloroflexota bacterium]
MIGSDIEGRATEVRAQSQHPACTTHIFHEGYVDRPRHAIGVIGGDDHLDRYR